MSAEAVKEYLKSFGLENEILTMEDSTASVALAAKALNIDEDQIAKTLSFYDKEDGCIIVVFSGNAKVQGGKFKRTFGLKPSMLKGDDVGKMTGHQPGGVSPFAVPETARVYLDKSLQNHEFVYPACGNSHNAIKITPKKLYEVSKAQGWVDVAKDNQ